ncbi:FAD-dependent oxidoreductase [Paenibacillus athensensis]|uniref:FAD-dependent oxidoreductase n=1 Tax=Paenibacillus athensensis TaxID=1967502 RepID=A0A4Y8Q317_9BACL|nr:FAD-dependent oxidoreductase [Paenibacillus athensensis]MCD1258257.1 FAD-dependent oxidoreductase [Paenibacillus athensensis]
MAKGTSSSGPVSKGWLFWMWALIVAAVLAAAAALYVERDALPQQGRTGEEAALETVQSVKQPKSSYDVIVVGTDPEGVTAAISAARSGLSTLLVDGRDRDILGGLMTLGWLNSIDMNYKPDQHGVFNKGLFTEWFDRIEGDSFDVVTAANAFYDLVRKEPNIDVLLKAQKMEPLVESSGAARTVTGVQLTLANGSQQTVHAKSVIDATQDADIAAAAGVPYTYGREDIGDKNAKMAVTLVFRLKNVTPDVWSAIQKRLKDDKDPGTDANEVSAWGYGELYNYPEFNKGKAKMRGLNIGRQNNNTALINALQIFGIDGSDPQSRAEAVRIGQSEAEHVVDYLKSHYAEFAGVELDATAPEPYVRETRHMLGEYRLNIIDLLENRDQWDRIAIGSYEADIQRIAPTDGGAVVLNPQQYAVPFRSLVPLEVDGLLVVGRAASYDSLAHGSARVIPTGMAEGQSAGAAAKLAQEKNMTFRQLSASKADIAELQSRLNQMGMELQPFTVKPAPYMTHKSYEGLKAAVRLALATGGYKNEFALDDPSNAKRMVNLAGGAKKIKPAAFAGDPSAAIAGMNAPDKAPLTLEQACYTLTSALGAQVQAGEAQSELMRRGLLTEATLQTIANRQSLSNGDTYMLIKDLQAGLTGTP